MESWESRELQIQNRRDSLRRLARGTLDTSRTLMKATSGDDFEQVWRTYLDEMMLACREALDNG